MKRYPDTNRSQKLSISFEAATTFKGLDISHRKVLHCTYAAYKTDMESHRI